MYLCTCILTLAIWHTCICVHVNKQSVWGQDGDSWTWSHFCTYVAEIPVQSLLITSQVLLYPRPTGSLVTDVCELIQRILYPHVLGMAFAGRIVHSSESNVPLSTWCSALQNKVLHITALQICTLHGRWSCIINYFIVVPLGITSPSWSWQTHPIH